MYALAGIKNGMRVIKYKEEFKAMIRASQNKNDDELQKITAMLKQKCAINDLYIDFTGLIIILNK